MAKSLLVTKQRLQMGLNTAKALEDAGLREPESLREVRKALKGVLRRREAVPFDEVRIDPNLPPVIRERVAHIVAAAATLSYIDTGGRPQGDTESIRRMTAQCRLFKEMLLCRGTTQPFSSDPPQS